MARSTRAAAAKFLLWFVTLVLTLGAGVASSPWAQDELPPASVKIAFLGDQGLGPNSRAVLNLIKEEGAQAVLHQGDFDYQDDPPAWDAQITDVLGASFPYFAVTGNHDTSAWSGPSGYGAFIEARMRRVGVPWVGQLGIQFAFKYEGLFVVMTAPGTTGSGHEGFIRQQFAADSSTWRISAWHKNMRLMQVGGKSDETGWGAYEESRKAGAIVATAHEHTYHRTHLMSSFQNQTVAGTDNVLALSRDDPATAADEGRSFVFVSGLGGQSIRDQERSGPWWASIYTSTQGANFGALFGTFNVNGNPRLAHFYFKDISGKIADDFFVLSLEGGVTPPDTTAPTVSLTAPADGASVSGAVSVSADATDDVGVARVEFTLDGNPLGAADTTAPYAVTWNTTTVANGSHTLGARASDAAGHTASATRTVTVTNGDTTPPAVSVTSPASGRTVSGEVTVAMTASDNVGVTRVDYLLDGTTLAVFSPPVLTLRWDSRTASNGPHTLTVRAHDAAGNTGSAAVTVTAANDFTAPVVSLTAPAADATVSGPVAVTASAVDDVGVVGVQFTLDGSDLGAEDRAAPYTMTWDTASATPGIHTLTAVGRDAAGNSAVSAARTVTLARDLTPPAISAVSAASLTASSATVAWASDEPSDSQVEYGPTPAYGSITPLDPTLTMAHSRVLSGLAAGIIYHYRVRSKDAAGNAATSEDFTFTTLVATDPGPGLVGHWTFEEVTCTTVVDASGHGLTGSLINGPALVAGRHGAVLAFDGLNQYVSVPHTAALNAYPLTVAAWINTTSTTGVRGIVNKYATLSFNGWSLFLNAGRLCASYFRDRSNNVNLGGGCPFGVAGYTDGQWHHVAFVVDAAGGRLYVDGAPAGSIAWTGTPGAPSTTQPLHLARYPRGFGGAEYFSGLLDDARIYNRALTAEELQNLYLAGAVVP